MLKKTLLTTMLIVSNNLLYSARYKEIFNPSNNNYYELLKEHSKRLSFKVRQETDKFTTMRPELIKPVLPTAREHKHITSEFLVIRTNRDTGEIKCCLYITLKP